jgi:hypothetical protein
LLFVIINRELCNIARMVFLVKGHTKNDADRIFNLMKHEYRTANVYTPADLFAFIARSNPQFVELVDVVNDDKGFWDWSKYEDQYMNATKGIQQHHIFTVNSKEPDILWCQEADGYPLVKHDYVVKKKYVGKKWAANLHEEILPLEAVGMKDIKWVTLYDKWRPLVPHDKRATFKYYHTDPGPQRRANIKENKKLSAELRKNRSVTVQDGDDEDEDDGDKKPAAKKTAKKAPKKKVTAVKAKPTAKAKKPDSKAKAKKNSKKK